MACRLFSTKPLSEPMLPYCQLGPKEHISVSEIAFKIQKFSFKKMHWKFSSAKCRPCCPGLNELTYWGRVTHICVSKIITIGSDNGLSPGRRQAIIWTNAGILLIGPLGLNFNEVLIEIKAYSFKKIHLHYCDVIMGEIASQIFSLTIVYSTVYSGADQRKHQSSASLAFVWGIHRGPVNSPHKWSVTRKKFPLDDVIMWKRRLQCGVYYFSASMC